MEIFYTTDCIGRSIFHHVLATVNITLYTVLFDYIIIYCVVKCNGGINSYNKNGSMYIIIKYYKINYINTVDYRLQIQNLN